VSALAFELPQALEAREPPEARGLARDEVRLMVATRGDGAIAHARFRDLPRFLAPGDAVVVNVSATLPAALAARTPDGRALEVRFSTPAPQAPGPEWWVVELRAAGGGRYGEREQCLEVAGGGTLEIVAPFAALGRL